MCWTCITMAHFILSVCVGFKRTCHVSILAWWANKVSHNTSQQLASTRYQLTCQKGAYHEVHEHLPVFQLTLMNWLISNSHKDHSQAMTLWLKLNISLLNHIKPLCVSAKYFNKPTLTHKMKFTLTQFSIQEFKFYS